ncbi:MAG: hypothetical protein GPJ51_13670 [Candidatus Heimdallarchaeota archaeon]|nr:hypothetical protein [Candidatus Heimdallarchaeota archaeon]
MGDFVVVFTEQSKQWYYTIKAMNDAIKNRQTYAFFLSTNYRNIKDGNYKWKKGFEPKDETALLRLINADMMSHVIKNIESLVTLARVGLLAKKKGIDHDKMRKWYFSTNMSEINDTINILKNNESFDIWKWVLWINGIEEIKESMTLSDRDVETIEDVYQKIMVRTKFVFSFIAEFWNLYKPVRNAFSHTFQFVPYPKNTKVPERFDDAILVFGQNWNNNNPIEMAILTGDFPVHIMAESIAAFNLFEHIIFENHIRSIQLNSKRILPDRIIGDVNKKLFQKYLSILQRTPRLTEIQVKYKFKERYSEIEKQITTYESFREKLDKLGTRTSFDNVQNTFKPILKKTKKLKKVD